VFEDEIVSGNKVAGRGYITGTHRGELRGIAPTGKTVKVEFMDVWRIEGNRIAEYWGVVDFAGLAQQLQS
jgi:predicted ester cyclase